MAMTHGEYGKTMGKEMSDTDKKKKKKKPYDVDAIRRRLSGEKDDGDY
jgi:cytochrome c556